MKLTMHSVIMGNLVIVSWAQVNYPIKDKTTTKEEFSATPQAAEVWSLVRKGTMC